MLRKIALFLSLFVILSFGVFFVRAYLQMLSPLRPVYIGGISSRVEVSRGRGIYLSGAPMEDGGCLKTAGECFCLKTVPSQYRRVFQRPLFSLPPVVSASSHPGSIIRMKEEGCHEVFQVRIGKQVRIRSCRGGFLIKECERRSMKPGVFYTLEDGETAILLSAGLRIRIVEVFGAVPAKKGGKIRVFQIRRRELLVEERVREPVFSAYLRNSALLPVKKGASLYHPLTQNLPMLPPFFYPSQRDAFLSLYIKAKAYVLREGKFLPLAKGWEARAGRVTGDWTYFRKELEALNRSLGGNVYSKMPCWRAGSLGSLPWYYSFNPPWGWRTSPSLWGWERAEEKQGWICGKFWNPHFTGERTVYFKAKIEGPGEISLEPPPNGIFFLDGEVCGRGRMQLRQGSHIISLMLRVEGAGRAEKIRVNSDLSLSIENVRRNSVFPQKRKVEVIFLSSPPAVKLLQGKYAGLVVHVGRGVYIFPEPESGIRLRIEGREFLIPVREVETRYYTLMRLRSSFALADAVILKDGGVWVLRAKEKVSGPSRNFLSYRNGKYIWGGRSIGQGETFALGDWVALAGAGNLEDEEAFSSIFSYLNSAFSRGKVNLTIHPELQRLAYSLIKEEIYRIRRREEQRAKSILERIGALKRKIQEAKRLYREKRDAASARALLKAEDELTGLRYRLWKVKNPFYEGAIVLMDGEGRILASASYPPDSLNRGWGETYNVGSTFKLVDSIALLSSSSPYVRRLLRKFPFAGPGSDNLRGKRLLTGIPIKFDLRNFRGERIPYGVDFQKAFAHSLNVYFAYLTMHLYPPLLQGREQLILPLSRLKREFPLLRYAEELGFNHRFELTPLPGAIFTAKSVFPINAYRLSEIAHYSIGQAGLRATPLQMGLVALTIARDGIFIPPRLVDEVSLPQYRGRFRAEPRRVFSRRVARIIKNAMRRVVLEGTARGAFSGWKWPWQVYAKTGTAETSLYKDNSLFVGYLKMGKRILVFSVVVPRSGLGGRVAGRLARKLLDAYIKYLGQGR